MTYMRSMMKSSEKFSEKSTGKSTKKRSLQNAEHINRAGGTGLKRVLAFAVSTVMVVSLMLAAAPQDVHALYKDAMSVYDPYVIKADGQQLAVVASRDSAQAVVTGLKLYYCKDVAAEQAATVTTSVTFEKLPLSAGGKTPIVSTEAAVRHIVSLNKTQAEPAVKVESKSIGTETQAIKHKTKVIKTDKLYRGTKEIAEKGSDGEQEVTSSITTVNGEVTEKNVVSTEVTKKAQTKVVLRGTKDIEGIEVDPDSGATGVKVVEYAMKWLGNPYVWGGESLTDGCDCSGFTMLVYGHFGVELPHYSYSQEAYGKEIKSLDDAAAGDLICYGSHVAIYIGNDKMINAANPKAGITIGTADYRKIVTIRRLV